MITLGDEIGHDLRPLLSPEPRPEEGVLELTVEID